MLALFCLRLAVGLLACLLVLSPAQVNPRFYRTHFLIALGLGGVAIALPPDGTTWAALAVLAGGLVLSVLGFLSWSLEGAPAGRTLAVLAACGFGASVVLMEVGAEGSGSLAGRLTGDLCASLLLGSATTAMLMGHSYLNAPSLSITPLQLLLVALFGAAAARLAVSAGALALWCWTEGHSLLSLQGEAALWLPVRWALGLVAPLVLAVMAWQTARIRSTQSATGILYVAVIFCFLGELTGQLLQSQTGYAL